MLLIVAISIVGFVSRWGNRSIMNFASILDILCGLFIVFEVVTRSLTLAIDGIDWGGASIHYIGLEKIGNFSNIVRFKFFTIER